MDLPPTSYPDHVIWQYAISRTSDSANTTLHHCCIPFNLAYVVSSLVISCMLQLSYWWLIGYLSNMHQIWRKLDTEIRNINSNQRTKKEANFKKKKKPNASTKTDHLLPQITLPRKQNTQTSHTERNQEDDELLCNWVAFMDDKLPDTGWRTQKPSDYCLKTITDGWEILWLHALAYPGSRLE